MQMSPARSEITSSEWVECAAWHEQKAARCRAVAQNMREGRYGDAEGIAEMEHSTKSGRPCYASTLPRR